ncbi:MAG: transglutaminase-like domain-containing protein [Paludibacter sp.]|nr:transglutaminase-like domain-containing protein [Prevotella sp.]MCM1443646.1 transglutaminase-like domain-containing protein [Muribaculum sp.]MCM1482521.1 transglutaminase-like domain-containing protein [Paludibacter sp.]MCM1576897.1 transglutaminase-like domain-containing protein [Bacteroides sp.]
MMKATGKNDWLGYGNNRDVVRNVVRCYDKWSEQPREIVSELRNVDVDTACYSIFLYLVDHVRYQEDKAGYQFIKSPARLLADGVGDCKSMTLFIASCLHCLGIPHIIRFVNFDGGNQYTHVYPIAFDENRQPIVLDAVERDKMGNPIYNYARDFKKCYDIEYYE